MLKVVGKKHQRVDVERILRLFAVALPYDYQNLVAEELSDSQKGEMDNLLRVLKEMEKAGKISKKSALDIRTAIGTAENVQKQGSDPR